MEEGMFKTCPCPFWSPLSRRCQTQFSFTSNSSSMLAIPAVKLPSIAGANDNEALPLPATRNSSSPVFINILPIRLLVSALPDQFTVMMYPPNSILPLRCSLPSRTIAAICSLLPCFCTISGARCSSTAYRNFVSCSSSVFPVQKH